ncbi:MAG: histidinol-phosphate transaminase [Verrucomicrobiota bacterium]
MIWEWANENLKNLKPYEPGKPIESVARELGLDAKHIIKLASNENPMGPSSKALHAMRNAIYSAHLYPDGGGFYLRSALAQKHGVEMSQIVLGAGSNEIIELFFHAFVSKGKGHIVCSKYAFIVYKLCAMLFGCEYTETEDKNFSHDLNAMLAAIRPDTKLIFVTNANNPTGTRIPNEELKEFVFKVPENVVIALDEAYYEFMENPPDTLEWMKQKPNLVLLRTFSKIHGLAALRIGYGLMQPEMGEILQRCRQPFNTNAIAQAAALAALDDEKHQQKTIEITIEGRKTLENFCREKGIEFIPSHGNFVMMKVGDGEGVFHKLQEKGVIVRPLRGGYRLAEWIRVTVGTPEQMKHFYEAFNQVYSAAVN